MEVDLEEIPLKDYKTLYKRKILLYLGMRQTDLHFHIREFSRIWKRLPLMWYMRIFLTKLSTNEKDSITSHSMEDISYILTVWGSENYFNFLFKWDDGLRTIVQDLGLWVVVSNSNVT